MWVLEALRCLFECYNRNLVCYEQRRSRKPSQVFGGTGVRSRLKETQSHIESHNLISGDD